MGVKVGGEREREREGMDNEKATRSVRKDFIIRPATGFDISRKNYFVCPRSYKLFKRSLKVILAHNFWWSCRTFLGNCGFRGSLNQ